MAQTAQATLVKIPATFAAIGSVSTGTHREEDLENAYGSALLRLARTDPDRERKAEVTRAIRRYVETDKVSTQEFVNEVAPDLLQMYAGPHCYFGSHPANGSDFGFWPELDYLEELAAESDGVVKIDAEDGWPNIPEGVQFVLVANPRGSVSLYEASTRRFLWECI